MVLQGQVKLHRLLELAHANGTAAIYATIHLPPLMDAIANISTPQHTTLGLSATEGLEG